MTDDRLDDLWNEAQEELAREREDFDAEVGDIEADREARREREIAVWGR